MRWLSIPKTHLTTLSASAFARPSSDSPESWTNPCATSCELMYCKLDVEEQESDEPASENGERRSERDASRAQWTSFLGVAEAMVVARRADIQFSRIYEFSELRVVRGDALRINETV